jgi:signal transduction histidine kinase
MESAVPQFPPAQPVIVKPPAEDTIAKEHVHLTEKRLRELTTFEGPMKAVNDIADQLGQTITGDFNFRVQVDDANPTIQKLVMMVNFALETTRQAIDTREKAEKDMESLVKELQGALLFKDQFLATMSHELRTPLNAITGFSGIALMQDDLSPDIEMMLERIQINSKRLMSLINDILDISRINAGRIEILSEDVNLWELVKGWREDFNESAANKGLALELTIDPSLPQNIQGDPDRITQVAANLIGNAIKFTERGSIRISAAPLGETHWILTISDTGIGIPDTWQHLIFEEFRQVDGSASRKYGGAGLGLSIVRKLCLLMGGNVVVSSKPGDGTTFTVTLPQKITSVAVGGVSTNE